MSPTKPPSVSPPLPLPLSFALLPSHLPSRTLTPAIYSVVNGLSVYLLLPPSHEPHLSLLPLILALHPIPPIHILSQLKLKPTEYSFNLDGLAPWVDFWVPWEVGRRICTLLGVGVLFWDKIEVGKGLLGEVIHQAVSWDEDGDGGICHNWLPAASHLPPSAYSLSSLLKVPFPSISIIPEDRIITTFLDLATRARIIAQSDYGNPTGIGGREWMEAWEGIIRWSAMAWNDFLRYPSTPPPSTLPNPNLPPSLPSIINSLLPKLPNLAAASTSISSPSYLPTYQDIRQLQHLLSPLIVPTPPTTNIFSVKTLKTYFNPIHLLPKYFRPFPKTKPHGNGLSPAQIAQLQLTARINLGTAEWVGWMMVHTWKSWRERKRMKTVLEGSGRSLPRDIVIIAHPRDSSSAGSVVSTKGKKESWVDDPIEKLERLRGGSPPLERIDGGRREEMIEKTEGASSTSSPTTPRATVFPKSDTNPARDGGTETRQRPVIRLRRIETDESSLDDDGHGGGGFEELQKGVKLSTVETRRMLSEDPKEWWLYLLSLAGMSVIAVILGRLT